MSVNPPCKGKLVPTTWIGSPRARFPIFGLILQPRAPHSASMVDIASPSPQELTDGISNKGPFFSRFLENSTGFEVAVPVRYRGPS